MDAAAKLAGLRQQLAAYQGGPLDAYIILSEDAHQVSMPGYARLYFLMSRVSWFIPPFVLSCGFSHFWKTFEKKIHNPRESQISLDAYSARFLWNPPRNVLPCRANMFKIATAAGPSSLASLVQQVSSAGPCSIAVNRICRCKRACRESAWIVLCIWR